MSTIIKKLSFLGVLFKNNNNDFEYQSEQLTQLKNSLDPENNMRVYYHNVVGYFNTTIDKVKNTNGVK